MDNQQSVPESRGLSRRAAVGAAAWSVPAVAVAAGAPAFAASNLGTLSIILGQTQSVPHSYVVAGPDDEEVQHNDQLVVANLRVVGNRTVAATALSLTFTFVPDEPDFDPVVYRRPSGIIDAGWTAAVVNPSSPTSSFGEAVQYSRGGFTGSAGMTFAAGTTANEQMDNELIENRVWGPGRWKIRAEAAGFAPSEIFLVTPVPNGSTLAFQPWGQTIASRGQSFARGETPAGVLVPPAGLTSDYTVEMTVEFLGVSQPSSITELGPEFWTRSGGSVVGGTGAKFTQHFAVPKDRAVHIPSSSFSLGFQSSAVPAFSSFRWTLSIVGTSHTRSFTATP